MGSEGPPTTACYDEENDKWIPGCPFLSDEGEGYCILVTHGDLNPFDCHLTPAYFSLLNAMTAGEWSCETCNVHDSCPAHDRYGDVPCRHWL